MQLFKTIGPLRLPFLYCKSSCFDINTLSATCYDQVVAGTRNKLVGDSEKPDLDLEMQDEGWRVTITRHDSVVAGTLGTRREGQG